MAKPNFAMKSIIFAMVDALDVDQFFSKRNEINTQTKTEFKHKKSFFVNHIHLKLCCNNACLELHCIVLKFLILTTNLLLYSNFLIN